MIASVVSSFSNSFGVEPSSMAFFGEAFSLIIFSGIVALHWSFDDSDFSADGCCDTSVNDCCFMLLVDCEPSVTDWKISVAAVHHCINQFSPNIPPVSRGFPINKSFGIKCWSCGKNASITGWRPPRICMDHVVVISGFTYFFSFAKSAWEVYKSSQAIPSASSWNAALAAKSEAFASSNNACSEERSWNWADKTLRCNSSKYILVYLCPVFNVWRRIISRFGSPLILMASKASTSLGVTSKTYHWFDTYFTFTFVIQVACTSSCWYESNRLSLWYAIFLSSSISVLYQSWI